MQQQSQKGVKTVSSVLPKGGGTIQGMGEALSGIGSDGMAHYTLPLPVSSGRGVAPQLSLSYTSGNGNSPFGLGWQLPLLAIRRQTNKGTPQYAGNDHFIGTEGEVLVMELDTDGNPLTDQKDTLQGSSLADTYTVTRYRPRIESSFHCLEYWLSSNATDAFWLLYASDGNQHLLGKNSHTRITNPGESNQIAEWLIEETLTPTQEHIYYQYQAEDDTGLEENDRTDTAQRYISTVYYGNKTPQSTFYALEASGISEDDWLFMVVFDYGERNATDLPAFDTSGNWTKRSDPFSTFHYGFEVRSYRLCRQVLLFHRIEELAGAATGSESPTLITALRLCYDESPVVSCLAMAEQSAWETDGSQVLLPPLEFDYRDYSINTDATTWEELEGFTGIDNGTNYQLVDLYGEGIPGILYRDGKGWQYRSVERSDASKDNDSNAVQYGATEWLRQIPTLREGGTLMDLNGDGKLNWVISQHSYAGYYSSNPDHTWTSFTPLSAIPVEFAYPNVQLGNMAGAGFPDVALIGPESVRWYPNKRDGFGAAITVLHDGEALPAFDANQHELVAFADVLGSGQQHLVRVTQDGVECFPNLGHGRFGEAISIPGFQLGEGIAFQPHRVHFADLDGSGAMDILYATSDALLCFTNQSGNGFDTPIAIPFPEGIHFDDTCRLSIGDMQGLGISSILFSIPHIVPRHFQLNPVTAKPYLLTEINNNRGGAYTLQYRSSVQFWLDEKARGNQTVSFLPFPVHLVAEIQTLDEITGNRLTQTAGYYHGFYDGVEREFRGFGRVDITDTNDNAAGTQDEVTSFPSLTKSWYHTGQQEDESRYTAAYWQGDDDAYTLGSTYLTEFNTEDIPLTDESNSYWLFRALKGSPLRTEVYGLDGSAAQENPYTVQSFRYQVRLVQNASDSPSQAPVVVPFTLEQLSYHYERIPEDPKCTQQIQVQTDACGFPLQQIAIQYPRRSKPGTNPYPSVVPQSAWSSSYDAQQNVLRITETLSAVNHITDIENEQWRLGLPTEQRVNMLHPDASGSISFESVTDILGADAERIYAGQQKTYYTEPDSEDINETPTILGLVACTETAEFDDQALTAFDNVLSTEALEDKLTDGGYQKTPRLLSYGDEEDVWAAQLGFTKYAAQSGFCRPVETRNSQLVGRTTLVYDTYTCAVIQSDDPMGNSENMEYNYRFLVPCKQIDIHGNVHLVELDALGRVTASRFWGMENGSNVGFPTPDDQPFAPPVTIQDAVDLEDNIPVAGFAVYDPFSWMPEFDLSKIPEALVQELNATNVLTVQGRQCRLASRRWLRRGGTVEQLKELESDNPPEPPHTIQVNADAYFEDTNQQLQKQVVFSDGFGRTLQASQKVETGTAYVRLPTGNLQVGDDDQAVQEESDERWAVTGKTEYDNKGQAIRSYQPYFLNSWQYVIDDSTREDMYADVHLYDPTGREYKVVTAKGYEKRVHFFPWFNVSEDENDTFNPES
ncbi:MAG: hypothetical protein GKR88_05835 [Flavobacteriaceae bacterium]|nr:MAG: hypothetical protein GKR88_05835 [Flavobacteriaceae bacterium]